MRVKLSSNPPLPLVRVWFPLARASTSTVSTFKSVLCTSLPDFGGIVPSSLRLSIDGFELLDNSELSVVRDGDLISVDAREVPLENATAVTTRLDSESTTRSAPSRKRKRDTPAPTPSGFESDTESTSSAGSSSSDTSESESSASDSPAPRRFQLAARDAVLQKPDARALAVSCVPPGHGKPQTRARNLRRRLKRTHEREAASGPVSVPVSGANTVVPDPDEEPSGQDDPPLMSLSLRNKNKAKNFRSLMSRPLPAKIVFDEQEVSTRQGVPRLVPPSERTSLPPNMIVTSVDVEAAKKKGKARGNKVFDYGEEADVEVEVEVSLDYGEDEDKLEALARERWDVLDHVTRENVTEAGLVGYKALGIDPVTYTPGQVLTVGRVESCGCAGLVVRPLRGVSFGGHAEGVGEEHSWEEIASGEWRVLN